MQASSKNTFKAWSQHVMHMQPQGKLLYDCTIRGWRRTREVRILQRYVSARYAALAARNTGRHSQ